MTSDGGDPQARRLDGGAERLLGALAPLTIDRARDAAEVDLCHRMRHEMAVAMGWARPADHPGGREHDEHDARAVHLVCREAGRIVGCMRIVPPDADGLLPIERDFDLRVPDAGRTVEFGRMVVVPDRRGPGGLGTVAGLFAAGWLESRALGFDSAVAAASPSHIALYRAMGMRVRELAPPRPHMGDVRAPFHVAGMESDFLLREHRGPGSAGRRLTRRGLLAGSVGAAGLVVLGLPAAGAGQSRPRAVGAGPTDRTTLGLIARVVQEGRDLVAVGHLTRLRGLGLASLYTRSPGTISGDPAASDVSLARFTVVVRARIAALRVLGPAISAVGSGTAAIHLLPDGGARLDDTASFAAGRAVASFGVDFQNDLALDGPDNAAASLLVDLTQRQARAFSLDGRRLRIGGAGVPWTLRAAGRGIRSEPSIPRSTIFVSGGLAAGDGRPVGR